MKIYVTNLFDLPAHVAVIRPGYLVSIIQRLFQPETPPEIEPQRHLRVDVDDVIEPINPDPGFILFNAQSFVLLGDPASTETQLKSPV